MVDGDDNGALTPIPGRRIDPEQRVRLNVINVIDETADLLGLPPAIVAVAEIDILHDEGVAYAQKLRAAGVAVDLVEAKAMVHGFFPMPHMFESAEAYCIQLAERMRELMYAP